MKVCFVVFIVVFVKILLAQTCTVLLEVLYTVAVLCAQVLICECCYFYLPSCNHKPTSVQ